MSRGFATFMRIIGTIAAAILFLYSLGAANTHKINSWELLLSMLAVVLVAVFTYSYARLIDTAVDHEKEILELKEALEKRSSSK